MSPMISHRTSGPARIIIYKCTRELIFLGKIPNFERPLEAQSVACVVVRILSMKRKAADDADLESSQGTCSFLTYLPCLSVQFTGILDVCTSQRLAKTAIRPRY